MLHCYRISFEKPSSAGAIVRACLVLTLLAAIPAFAGTFNVNTTTDTHAANLTTGADASGNISLRSACEAANTQAGPNTINLPAGTYTLVLGEIVVGTSTNLNTTISGAGSASTVIRQTTVSSRIFDVGIASNIQVAVQNVTITNGQGAIDTFGGSGIIAGGPGQVLTVTNCVFTNNVSPAGKGNGGAIEFSAGGTLSVSGSSFSGNQANDVAQGSGGAIDFFLQSNVSGSLSISNCTFTNNTSSSTGNTGGGGVAVRAQGRVNGTTFSASIQNCTFSGNHAAAFGGGIMSSNASTTVLAANLNRFVSNAATSGGSAIAQISGTVGTINAENNWWGCDGAPGSAGCQTISGDPGGIDADPRIDLKLTATPSTIGVGGTSALLADVSKNTANATINPSVMVGLPVTFAGPFGTVSPASTTIGAGFTASSTYTNATCPGNPNVANTSATVDAGTQAAPVTVAQPPKLTACPSNISVSSDRDVCGAAVTYTAPADIQGCPPATVTCTPAPNSVFPIGTTTVICVGANGVAPNDTCRFTVTVSDTQKPALHILTVSPIYNTPAQCSAPALYSDSVSDNCPGATIACVPPPNTILPVGATPVKCTAADVHGNTDSVSFTITVADSQKPSITCHNDTTVANDHGLCSAVVGFNQPAVSDNCPGVGAPTCNPPSGTAFPKGSNTVTCSVTDAHNNTGTCTFHVTVTDTEKPVLSACPRDTTVSTGNPSGAVVTYQAPSATDNCQSDLSAVACNPASGSTFPVGTTTVTCSVSDRSGNSATCSFHVDVVPCTIVCRNDTTLANDPGACGAIFRFVDPATTGSCGTVTCSPASGSTFPIGTTTVRCTSLTVGSFCEFHVTVSDTEKPRIACPQNITQGNDPGVCGAAVSYAVPAASDNCPGAAVTCSPASGTTFPIGTTTVKCVALDASNNKDSCSFTIAVQDTQKPVLTCPAPITIPAGAGCEAVVNYATPSASDNCAGATVTCTPPSGSTFIMGTHAVTCVAVDASSNKDSCSFPVTVTPEADLSMLKTDNATSVVAGLNTTYVLTVGNTGPCPATNVTVTDVLPPGMTFISCTSDAGGVCGGTGGNRVVTFPVINPGTSATIIMNVQVSPSAPPGLLVNTAVVTSETHDPNPSNNQATDADQVSASADLSVVKTGPAADTVGTTIQYNIVVRNAGPSDAQSVTMTDVLPPGLTFVSGTNGATFDGGTGTVTLTAPALAPGDSATTTITAIVGLNLQNGLPLSNTANVTSPTSDPNRGNNSSTVTGTVVANADLSITKIATSPSVADGENTTFVITLINNGPAPAQNVMLIDQPPPPGLNLLFMQSGFPANATVTPQFGQMLFTQPIPVGVPIQITVLAQGACFNHDGATIMNVAIVTSPSNPDPNQANNTATATIQAVNPPPVVICPPPISIPAPLGFCSATVNFPSPQVSDGNCPPPPAVCTPPSGSTFPVGQTDVTCTASDAGGATASCTFSVRVLDLEPPTVLIPPPIIRGTDPDQCSAIVTYPVPEARDNCGPTFVTCTPPPGVFPKGTTPVSCVAEDTSHNAYTFSFDVTVNDVQAPSITCPAAVTQGTDLNQCSAVVNYPSPTVTDNCPGGIATCIPPSGSTFPKGATTVTCTATDASFNSSSCSFPVIVNDLQPPSITCPGNISKPADPGVCSAVVSYSLPVVNDNCPGVGTPTCTPPSGSTFQKGATTVNCQVTDASSNVGQCSFTVTVVDGQPPVLSAFAASPTSLWPPNHKMKDVYLTHTATDNCGVVRCAVSVTSNEPVTGTGDGDTSPDWVVIDSSHIQLRAERAASGNGRIYTVTMICYDAAGNASNPETTYVVCAHNIKSPVSGASFKAGTIVTFTGTFWDVPGNKHTVSWLVGSNTTVKGMVTAEPSGLKPGTVTGSYKFTAAGVYKLAMNITDQKGVTSTCDIQGDLEAIVVIYDPSAGYTFGGGWFPSQPGALPSNANAAGKGSIGFTSSYFKGATNPKGVTQFQFAVGNFEFNAVNFSYLSISSPKAQFKGSGKVTGDQSGYSFILTVIDGQAAGGSGTDLIRMKIYNKNTGQVMYDNQPGASDAADPVTAVGSNSLITLVTTSLIGAATASRGEEPEQTDGQLLTPREFALGQNFPNPFNPSTVISYALPVDSRVRLTIYNLLGEEVSAPVRDEVQAAGYQSVTLNAAQLPSGIYLYRLSAVAVEDASRSFSQTRKMILIK